MRSSSSNKRIRSLINELGITQTEFCNKTGIRNTFKKLVDGWMEMEVFLRGFTTTGWNHLGKSTPKLQINTLKIIFQT